MWVTLAWFLHVTSPCPSLSGRLAIMRFLSTNQGPPWLYVRAISPGLFSSIPTFGKSGAVGWSLDVCYLRYTKISQIYCITKSRFFIFHKSLLIRGFYLNSNAKNFRSCFNFCYESLCEFFLRLIFIKFVDARAWLLGIHQWHLPTPSRVKLTRACPISNKYLLRYLYIAWLVFFDVIWSIRLLFYFRCSSAAHHSAFLHGLNPGAWSTFQMKLSH